MRITDIEATLEKVILYADFEGDAWIRESVPTVAEKPGRTLASAKAEIKNGTVELPRFDGERDRIFSRYDVFAGGEPVEGVHYVTVTAPGVAADESDYPQPENIKTLGLPREMMLKYHVGQGLMNINLPALMAVRPAEDAISYTFNGRSFYFIKSAVEAIDRQMQATPIT
ncbi:MAG: hypothetical protein J6U72_06255, partial [Clostridia bacterium]|nr:hypothetical protein [Clostridia bacterium]